MRKSSPSRLKKGFNSKFTESYWNQQTPEEGKQLKCWIKKTKIRTLVYIKMKHKSCIILTASGKKLWTRLIFLPVQPKESTVHIVRLRT